MPEDVYQDEVYDQNNDESSQHMTLKCCQSQPPQEVDPASVCSVCEVGERGKGEVSRGVLDDGSRGRHQQTEQRRHLCQCRDDPRSSLGYCLVHHNME